MNLKLKALLITLGIVCSTFAFAYCLVVYPWVLGALFILATIYSLYKLILSNLEKSYRTKNGYNIEDFNKKFGRPK